MVMMQPKPKNPSRRTLPSGLQGPLHPGGYHGYGREQRRAEAAERQAARDALTPRQQLARLDAKLGRGVGARRERARLQLEM